MFSSSLLEPIMELNAIQSRFYGDLAKQSMLAANDYMKAAQQQMTAMTQAKSLPETLRQQLSCISELNGKAIENSQQCLESCLQASVDYQHFFEKNFEKASLTKNATK